ncbi:hypothetical protein KM043_006226 [Ampulex compressa]|nr:hypothetical protein KM043_006226 [Ampulex compressa]
MELGRFNVIFLALLGILYLELEGKRLNQMVTWCTVSDMEQQKCMDFANDAKAYNASFGDDYIPLQCKQAFNKEECMVMLEQEEAEITMLDAGEVFIAGRYHSLVPIMQEIYEGGLNYQYAVAVIKNGSLPDVQTLHDLRGKKACFAGVGTLGSWIIPVHNLMKRGGMEIVDCNNHVKSTIKYFGHSCAVNSLIDKYNPLGDNSDQLCKLCIGKVPSARCTNADPYVGYGGAFRCLVEAGEIAFLVHTTVQEMTSTTFDFNASIKKENFNLLCRDGTRKSIDEYRLCNWGTVPSRAVVTSSATKPQIRRLYQRFLEKAVHILNRDDRKDFSGTDENRSRHLKSPDNANNGVDNRGRLTIDGSFNNREAIGKTDNTTEFQLFDSVDKYKEHNLIFSDSARDFVEIPEKSQNYTAYLGRSIDSILEVRQCPVSKMTLCVTSDPEMEKCIKMKIALKAQLLKPDLYCYKGHSQINCMDDIQHGLADVMVLDASDVYTAGLRFQLIPFISEVYNLPTPEYYAVAVAKEEDEDTDLTYLKNKYTCHTGINTAAGWVYPLAYLISNKWIRGYGCDSVRAAAEYFSKSCVPGALSTEYNTGVPYDNMCDLCHGASYRYCRRDASEDYFGYTGAFRCLVEGGGHVAFVKHTTVAENTDGKRREMWARNTFTKDFELLCTDGTRRPTTDYEHCNLGKVAANAIVTRGGYGSYNETEINAYINLFIYAQQLYGRKEQDEFSFSMFYSAPPYSDLIFQDATQQLTIVPKEKRQFSAYLGSDFMRARRIVDCHAGASLREHSVLATFAMILLTCLFSR